LKSGRLHVDHGKDRRIREHARGTVAAVSLPQTAGMCPLGDHEWAPVAVTACAAYGGLGVRFHPSRQHQAGEATAITARQDVPHDLSDNTRSACERSLHKRAIAVLAWLERQGSAGAREGMARYAIRSEKIFGVSVSRLRAHAKRLGRDHDLAAALWGTGWHEARMLAAFVEDPEQVTPAQMDRWCRDFDNWAVCDTVCLHLFTRTSHAWRKVALWSGRRDEFVRRAAFSLLAALAVHDKQSADAPFLMGLSLIESAADDERNFVRKAVNWALRAIGRRNADLKAAAVEAAQRLAGSPRAATRWVGRDALKALTGPAAARQPVGTRQNAPRRSRTAK
jgi:3-methyladenine DNA glycosylase AlkD